MGIPSIGGRGCCRGLCERSKYEEGCFYTKMGRGRTPAVGVLEPGIQQQNLCDEAEGADLRAHLCRWPVVSSSCGCVSERHKKEEEHKEEGRESRARNDFRVRRRGGKNRRDSIGTKNGGWSYEGRDEVERKERPPTSDACSRDVVAGRFVHVSKRDGRQGQSDRHKPRMNGGGSLIGCRECARFG
jgi:hypothetical protein